MVKQTFTINQTNFKELKKRATKKNDKSRILNQALNEYFSKQLGN